MIIDITVFQDGADKMTSDLPRKVPFSFLNILFN